VSPDARRSGSAVAVEPVDARVVRRDDFEVLRGERPSLDRFLIGLLADRVRQTSARLVEALYVPADARVLRRVHSLAALYDDGTSPVVIPLTQDDVASMAGTTRSTANRVLKSAEDEGVLVLRRGRIEVVDRERLAKKAR